MFRILQKAWQAGGRMERYPASQARTKNSFRGKPAFELEVWKDARPAACACPTGAIQSRDEDMRRQVKIDLGRCIFCGLCEAASGGEGVRMTPEFELAVADRQQLMISAEYALNPDGSHRRLISAAREGAESVKKVEAAGRRLASAVRRVLGRSLSIRQVDAGSCNGCELEIGALGNPIYDIERFGIHFVASPRHADMLLVTGPVTRNMELALRKTYDATPEPRLVVAVGACGISGGIFGTNYATRGGIDQVIPVDVYIPGCPPRPEALLHGILLAVGRLSSSTGRGCPAEER